MYGDFEHALARMKHKVGKYEMYVELKTLCVNRPGLEITLEKGGTMNVMLFRSDMPRRGSDCKGKD